MISPASRTPDAPSPLAGLAIAGLAAAALALTLPCRPASAAPPPRASVRPTVQEGSKTKPVIRRRAQGGVTTRQGKATTTAATDPLAAELARASLDCGEHEVAETRLEGCDGTPCQKPAAQQRFVRLMGLEPGAKLRPNHFALSRQRLEKTGFFRVRHVRCRMVSGKARVTVEVLGNAVVRRVRFGGNQALFTDELRNKVNLQPGDVLNPGTDVARRQLEQQKRALIGAYAREGFDDVKVRLEVVEAGPGQVELHVHIDEGVRKRVADRVLVIQGRHKPTERERAAGLVCSEVAERSLLRASGLGEVDVYTRRAGVRAKSRVREQLRRAGYSNPKVSVSHDEANQRISVVVQLGRCSVVRLFERESAVGRSAGTAWRLTDDDDYLAALPFAQSGVFDLDEADRGRRALSALLENRGYLFSDVQLEVRDVPRAWNSRVQRAITYRITTGYPAQIRGLRFIGNKRFSDSELKSVITTRPYDFFDDGGYLQTAQLFGDLELLRQHYRSAGFFEFRYDLVAKGHSETLSGLQRERRQQGGFEVIDVTLGDRGFRLRRPDGEHFIYLDIPVSEGRQTRLGKLGIDGTDDAGERRARRSLGLTEGQVLSHTMLKDALSRVREWYAEHGYFQASVEALCRVKGASTESLTARVMTPKDPCLRPVVPEGVTCAPKVDVDLRCKQGVDERQEVPMQRCRPDEWCPCSAARMLAEQVDLRVRVREGPRVRFGEVFISGNFDTESRLLTEKMPKYGAFYSGQALFKALRAIRNTGLFRSVSFVQIGADECPPREHIAVLVKVVEGDHLTLDLDAGFQTANVNRTRKTGEPPRLLVDTLEHLVSAGARLNTGVGERIGARLPSLVLTSSADLRHRNFLGKGHDVRAIARAGVYSNMDELVREPLALMLGAVSYTIPSLKYDVSLRLLPFVSRDFVTTTIDLDKGGVAAEASKRFLASLSVSVGAEVALVRFRDATSATLSPFQWQWKGILRSNWDLTDSPLNPTRGLVATASVAWINAIIEDASNKTAFRGSFVKLDGQAKWHTTLRKTFTLALMLRGGYTQLIGTKDDGDTRLPPNEAFRLGGQLGVRGISDNGVLRYDRAGDPIRLIEDGEAQCQGGGTEANCASTGYAPVDSGNVMLAGSLEGRFPLFRKLGLWGAVFYDWGGIGGVLGDLTNPMAYRHGVGVGLRFLISGQIPLRIDYGIAADRRCAEPLSAGGTCGQLEDFGQLQTALLYAF